jgi:hypothetical protein
MSTIERWSPVTHDLGLVKTDADVAANEYQLWQDSLGAGCVRREAASLTEALDALPPLSMEKRRALFLPTASDWTVFFQNGIQGSDPFPAMHELTRRLGVPAMRVCATPPTAMWEATIWEVYAPPDQGGPPLLYRRAIEAMNDGGVWTFSESGSRYPFEATEVYSRKRKRDRFNRELLDEYLAHFGVRPFWDDFYVPSALQPAFIIERTQRWSEPAPEYSLDDVLNGSPWKREPTGRA